MSQSKMINVSETAIPTRGIIALAIIFVMGLFIIGFDQGHILGLVYGDTAFDDRLMHELAHDMRHAAGFPCH